MLATNLLDRSIVSDLLKRRDVEAGEKVKARRNLLRLTQAQLAGMAETTEATVCRIEAGQLAPRDNLRHAIAFALLLDVDDIWKSISRDQLSARAAELVMPERVAS